MMRSRKKKYLLKKNKKIENEQREYEEERERIENEIYKKLENEGKIESFAQPIEIDEGIKESHTETEGNTTDIASPKRKFDDSANESTNPNEGNINTEEPTNKRSKIEKTAVPTPEPTPLVIINPLSKPYSANTLKEISAARQDESFGAFTSTSEKRRKTSALKELMKEQEIEKEEKNRKHYWLETGTVVKVMNKYLADGKYYKKRGIVERLEGKFIGHIRMIDPEVKNHKLKLDQNQLETVLPQIGGKVKVVNGAYRGTTATLLSVDVAKFCAQIRLENGLKSGRIVDGVQYEDICKIYDTQ